MKGLVKYAKGEGNMAVQEVNEPKAGAGQIKVEILPGDAPAAHRLDGHPAAEGLDILPSEQVGHAEAVVRIRRERVERAALPVRRVLVAGGVVIGSEGARLPGQPVQAISGAELRSPGPQLVGASRPCLPGRS